ncbi:alpha/beta fold hydrolase [Dermatophilus congolensis]|nr:alpha/beta fold hydrolase [Dermatophilus congolensis]MBO3144488.1 alpha/beta fold hydrolase [Dermatophilus congolensis]MBO3148176.1 alpha/beta fold hydrolase [Dermatophilus congolensis]MBO3150450.1 alpha/beta fold hydrolase [Dermatophilus congolensis]MBO3153479.1 alpha/beta fold hydrolase [Dermatophilus congolensis]
MVTPVEIRSQLTGLPGIDPAWSRTVTAVDADGIDRTWHILDTHAPNGSDKETEPTHGTLLCVHGNPTWSYLWRHILAAPAPGWRVIAVDQLGMGFSENPRGSMAQPRTLAQRIKDLAGLTQALNLTGRVVAAGHDWGGMVATGWALEHRELLAGLVLANTTVHHDFDAGLPTALKFSLTPRTLRAATVDTPAFVRGTTAVSSPRPSRDVQNAYALPYRTRSDRSFVGQFVADIPTTSGHPTRATMRNLADGLSALGSETAPVPVLLLRGPKDSVFSEAHLRDLQARLPHADVHRYEGASHLVLEDAPRITEDIARWIETRVDQHGACINSDPAAHAGRPPQAPFAVGTPAQPWSGLTDLAHRDPEALCVAEVATGRRITFGQIDTDIEHVALGLRDAGLRPGDRVALLVEPGIDLTVAAYAAWRAGGVIVVADAGLGLSGMGRALRGAGVHHVIAMSKAMPALPALRVPGTRFLVGDLPRLARKALGVRASFDDLRARGRALAAGGHTLPASRKPEDDAAVLFTSGATGPSKGVVYTLDQIRAQVGGFGHIYRLTPGDRLVAAFAPFALYGPALGVAGVVPDMKVTAPATLTAAALADAVTAARGTTVFASPAALRNVLATSEQLQPSQRRALAGVKIVMSAGAPVPLTLLRRLSDTVFPHAEMHTPYGMTECLPVSDITLDELEQVYAPERMQDGVCVGRAIESVQIMVAPLPAVPDGPDGDLTAEAGVVGEICVRAPHMKDRYDQLWGVDDASKSPRGWHRTGDVGHLDGDGRLWVEGRRVHVIHTAEGPLTPVGLEQRVESLNGVANAAVVGVGPRGLQQLVVVLTPDERGLARAAGGVLADQALHTAVRAAADRPVAAVLVRDSMPVDIRHQSKIDRTALACWAEDVLAGNGGRR